MCVKAINSVGFGIVDKIFIEFHEAWWKDSENDEADTEGFGILFRGQGSRNVDYTDPDLPWHRGLLGFYLVEHRPKMLSGWVAGHSALKMEKLSDEQISRDSMEVIRRFLGKEYGNIPDPTAIKASLKGTIIVIFSSKIQAGKEFKLGIFFPV